VVEMLPLETVDDHEQRVHLVRKRIEAVSAVVDEDLQVQRSIVLDHLRKYLHRLEGRPE
jgi:hypothetical protein